jgi:D-amino peptidase
MKIYISCDMEGVAGVSGWEDVDARNQTPQYRIYRRYMTQEVRAAIDGAREAGATEIVVNDSHGPMRNLLWDEIPSDVRVIFGNRKPFSMVQGIDETFDAAFFTGYHGGIADADAALCHTYTPGVIYDVRVNGVQCTEATLNAALAGFYGVPVALITGDRTTVEGVQRQMPWAKGVTIKESIGNFAVDSISPQAAQAAIRTAASDALRSVSSMQPYRFTPPIALEIDLAHVEQADYAEMIPGFQRKAPRTVRFTHDDYPTIFKAFIAAFRLGSQARS